MLTGGPDVDPACYGEERHAEVYGVDRAADEAELALVRAAIDRGVPTLAICRGLQVLNVALGGTLHQHIPELPGIERHGRPGEPAARGEHPVDVDGRFPARDGVRHRRASPGRATTTRPSTKLGDGLRVTATAADGIVEGLELDGAWVLAVQWHPEDTAGRRPGAAAALRRARHPQRLEVRPDELSARPALGTMRARSSCLGTLPLGLRGHGVDDLEPLRDLLRHQARPLCSARRCRACVGGSAASAGTTNATAISPRSSSGMPSTATSAIFGCA